MIRKINNTGVEYTFKDPGNRRLSMTRTQGSINPIGSEEDFAADFNDDDDDMGAQQEDVLLTIN